MDCLTSSPPAKHAAKETAIVDKGQDTTANANQARFIKLYLLVYTRMRVLIYQYLAQYDMVCIVILIWLLFEAAVK